MFLDIQLENFLKHGVLPLNEIKTSGYLDLKDAKIFYQVTGEGQPIVLLHGGLGHSGNFNLVANKLAKLNFKVILIDSRGHGRSISKKNEYHYIDMANDTKAVLEHLKISRAYFVGWSDGAVTSLLLAKHHPSLVKGLYFFACNISSDGAKPFEFTKEVKACISRHQMDYKELNKSSDDFNSFSDKVSIMQRNEPNLTVDDLKDIEVPILTAISRDDEFITVEHLEYIAHNLANGKFLELTGVTHFAPLQNPRYFTQTIIDFIESI